MKNRSAILYWTARLVAAIVMFQTLFFKFTASEESVYIFTTVGMEPWGRLGVGALELIAAVLLLIPATAWLGGVLALGLMLGAIGMHLTILGIVVQNDGGYLFMLAILVALCSVYILFCNANKIIGLLAPFRQKLG